MSVTLVAPEPDDPDGPTFHFGALPVRAKIINGDPWFVAADLADVLDFRDAHNAVRGLDEDERGTHNMSTPGGLQEFVIVNESGLYSLILRSRKPEAKEFKRWVTREVLPSIRRTGQYSTAPRTYIEALRAAADEAERRELAELARDRAWGEATKMRAIAVDQHARIQRDAPKVGYVEHFVEPAEDSCTIRELAKELGTQERRLFTYLVSKRRIYKDRQGQYQPYAAWMKWFRLRDQPEAPRLPDSRLRTVLYVLPPGKEGVRLMLERDYPNGL